MPSPMEMRPKSASPSDPPRTLHPPALALLPIAAALLVVMVLALPAVRKQISLPLPAGATRFVFTISKRGAAHRPRDPGLRWRRLAHWSLDGDAFPRTAGGWQD